MEDNFWEETVPWVQKGKAKNKSILKVQEFKSSFHSVINLKFFKQQELGFQDLGRHITPNSLLMRHTHVKRKTRKTKGP